MHMDEVSFYRFLSEILPEVDWDDSEPLIQSGELTSLDVLVLAAGLYEKTGLTIPSTWLKSEYFASKQTIYNLYRQLCERGKA